jgi:hypothetical protein
VSWEWEGSEILTTTRVSATKASQKGPPLQFKAPYTGNVRHARRRKMRESARKSCLGTALYTQELNLELEAAMCFFIKETSSGLNNLEELSAAHNTQSDQQPQCTWNTHKILTTKDHN